MARVHVDTELAAAVDAVLGNQDLVGAITGLVHDDDLLAWSMVCRATREAQVAGGRALRTGNKACAGSVGRAVWALGLGVPVEKLQRAAASVGSVPVLRWSVEEAGCPIPSEDGEEMCERAAGAGSVEALAWLRNRGCKWDEWTCTGAARGGHLSVLQWARSQDPPCPWGVGTCYMAALYGQLPVLQWARSQDPACPWNRNAWYLATAGSQAASEEERDRVIDWLRAAGCPGAGP